MPKSFSTYLDALRFCAALSVVAAHFTFAQFTGGTVPYQGALAGMAVTGFFVLSGYVIRYVSVEKEQSLSQYAISRMARIYSVAIPALILTVTLDSICFFCHWPKSVPLYQYEALWKYLPIFLTFTSEVGPIHEQVLSDAPFWSLSYEVWYYILFAAGVYYTGWRRTLLVPLILIFVGPRILIYLPLWLLGVALYELHRRIHVPRDRALLMFGGSIVGLLAIRLTGVDVVADNFVNDLFGGWPAIHLHQSASVASSYLTAAMIALNLFAARYLELPFLNTRKARSVIAYCASFTFAIYLAHWPLMNFLVFALQHNPHSIASLIVLVVGTALALWFFGLVSEHQKGFWREVFRSLVAAARRLVINVSPSLFSALSPSS